jgi:hypothetical protein
MKLRDIGYVALMAATAAAFVLGSPTTGEAKAKKKMAVPPPAMMCIQPYMPVCGERGGMKFTYANACFAAKDGAKMVSDKACPVKKAKKGGKKKMAAMKMGKPSAEKSAMKKSADKK